MPDDNNNLPNNNPPSPPPQPAVAPETPDQQETVAPVLPQPMTVTPADPGKRRPKGKIIVTVLGALILVGGVGTGVFLVQRQQVVRVGAWDCKNYVFEVSRKGIITVRNGSARNEPAQKVNVFINGILTTTPDVPALSAGAVATLDTIQIPKGGAFSWQAIGAKDCQNSGSYQTTPTPTMAGEPTPTVNPSPTLLPTPTVTPTLFPELSCDCVEIKVFDTNWNLITDFLTIETGDVVRFAVVGHVNTGAIDKARFTINGTLMPETTGKRPATDEFYIEYKIPIGVSSFTVKAEVHHTELGWI